MEGQLISVLTVRSNYLIIMLFITFPKIECPSCNQELHDFEFKVQEKSVSLSIKVKYSEIEFQEEKEVILSTNYCTECNDCIYGKIVIKDKKIDNLIYWTHNSKPSYLKK